MTMQEILKALTAIQEPGCFFSHTQLPLSSLLIEVASVGRLNFPLIKKQVKTLIAHARPAQFGWRDQTLTDKNVRDAWEISKTQIKINHRIWDKAFTSALQQIKENLGLANTDTLTAELHNLLIYEPGQFFTPHQDSEKCDGMVASLVIILPSKHSGGSLLIDHQGAKKTFRTSSFLLHELNLIAFYADCYHEVKKLTEGYRVALTYNIIMHHNDTVPYLEQSSAQAIDVLTKSLNYYFVNKDQEKTRILDDGLRKWVYLLDHQYTQAGLSWQHLKNVDQVRANALKTVAETLDLEIYLTLADVQETWDCEVDHSSGYYEDPYDDEDEGHCKHQDYDSDENGDIRTTDLIDSSTSLRYWLNAEGKKLLFKECVVWGQQITWTRSSNTFKPFESEYEGYMGNYGNTMDRWYHRAAIVLWRKVDHYRILFAMDPEAVINEILSLSKKADAKTSLQAMLKPLLADWSSYVRRHHGSSLTKAIFILAEAVHEAALALCILSEFDFAALTPELTKQLVILEKLYGTPWCLKLFMIWAKPQKFDSLPRCNKLDQVLGVLSEKKQLRSKLTDWLLQYQLQIIIAEDDSALKHLSRVDRNGQQKERIETLISFMQACLVVNRTRYFQAMIEHIKVATALYPPLGLIQLLKIMKKNLTTSELKSYGHATLHAYIVKILTVEQRLGLRAQNDWSIQEKLNCTCKDCGALTHFLHSPEVHLLWPMAKDRRAHMHQIIDDLGIPVTHNTLRKGSPYTLVLKKTDELHKQAKQRYKDVQKALVFLQAPQGVL